MWRKGSKEEEDYTGLHKKNRFQKPAEKGKIKMGVASRRKTWKETGNEWR